LDLGWCGGSAGEWLVFDDDSSGSCWQSALGLGCQASGTGEGHRKETE